MRFLFLSVCLLASFIALSRQPVGFYGSHNPLNKAGIIAPAIMFNDDSPFKEYSIDIGFTALQKQSVFNGLTGLFTTQRGVFRFVFPASLPVLDDQSDHHLVFSREDHHIRVYLDGNIAATWYDQHNLLDIRFPWFNLEFFQNGLPRDWLQVNGVLVSTKPFRAAAKKQIISNTEVTYAVFPNPATDVIQIQSQVPVTRIVIYNSTGMELINRDLNNARAQIPVNHLPAGVYTLKIFHQNNVTGIKKFIKQ
jgi:hypothetical protein